MNGDWFKDLFIDEAKTALKKCNVGGTVANIFDSIEVTDATTGTAYIIYVDNGKLSMREKED